MKTTDFASIVTLIRVRESKLLNKSQYDKLIEAETLEAAIRLLQETTYGSFIEDCNFEAALNSAAQDMYKELYKYTPYKSIIDFMAIKYDYHNIKVLIKGKILAKDFSHMLIHTGTIETESLKSMIASNDLKNMSEPMKDAVQSVFNDYENFKDAQRIDIILDRYSFEHMKQLSNELNDEFINNYLATLTDLTNIKTILRVKNLNKDKAFFESVIIPGGKLDIKTLTAIFSENVETISNILKYTDYGGVTKEGIEVFLRTKSLSTLENKFDTFLMNYMKKAKFINLGLEPIVTYIFSKETEIKNLRIILSGKVNKVPNDLVRERLRDSYV